MPSPDRLTKVAGSGRPEEGLRPYLAGQRSRLVGYLVLLLTSALLAVAVPPAFQRAVDDGLAAHAPDAALTWIGVAAALGLLSLQPYAIHAQSKAGAVVSRLTRSPAAAQNLVQSIFGLTGHTMLVIAHRPSTIRYAEQTVRLDHGRVAAVEHRTDHAVRADAAGAE